MKTAAKDFKMTELGPIPKDWDVKRLGELLEVKHGYAFSSDWFSKEPSKAVLVTPINFRIGGGFKPNELRYYVGEYPSDYVLMAGDLIVTMTDLSKDGDALGYAALVPGDGHVYLHNQRIGRCKLTSVSIDKAYLYWQMCTRHYQQSVVASAAGTTVRHTSPDRIGNISVVVPPLPEQRKIAAALSDVDEMIAALEKLIEKKRKIKTGAMQRLLTGQTRLPGFKGAWVEKRLGEVVEMCTNTIAINQINVREYVGTENMLSNRQGIKEFDEQLPYVNVREYRCGDILISNIRPYLKKIWLSDRAGGCSTDVLVLRSKEEGVESSFLYSVLCDDSFFDFVMANAVGTKMPRGDKKVIVDYVLFMPPTLAEQKAIAKVLGDMDEEIAALEAELAKTRQLKQGMMQELLTGKVRLV